MNIQILYNITNKFSQWIRNSVTYLVKFIQLEQSGGQNRTGLFSEQHECIICILFFSCLYGLFINAVIM